MRPVVPVLGLTVLFVLGCAGFGSKPASPPEPAWTSYPQRVDALVGHRIHEASEWLGSPTLTEDLGAGATRYSWDWRAAAATPAGDGGAKAPGFDCLTVIEADMAGKITTAKAEGANCVGVPPRKGPQDGAPAVPVEEAAPPVTPGSPTAHGPGTPRPSAPAVEPGPIRVHRAGNVDPRNGGSAEPVDPSPPAQP